MTNKWSNWIAFPFNSKGLIDLKNLEGISKDSGIYAISSKWKGGSPTIAYVGRSSKSIYERVRKHLTGHGNRVIASQLVNAKAMADLIKAEAEKLGCNVTSPHTPRTICVTFFPTKEPKIAEAAFLDDKDRPICNMIRACLPAGLTWEAIRRAKLNEH